MKHAGPDTLALLPGLLDELRALGPLVERTPGAFYLKSKAFLHFHEDPSGIFADVRLDFVNFTWLPVSSKQQQSALLAHVRRCLR